MSTDALRATALELFDKYFAENYPGPHTIISDPHWHAPKIFRAVLSCLKEAAADETEKLPAKWRRQARVDCDPSCGSTMIHARGLERSKCADELEAALKADRQGG